MQKVLSLKIETLRDLTPDEAQRVNGGFAAPVLPGLPHGQPVSSAPPPPPPHHGGGITAPVSSARPPQHGRYTHR